MQYTGGTNPVDSAFVKIVQIQGNSLATMDIKLFDQVKVTDFAGKFDVGSFGINVGQDTPDQLLHFTAQATDGDGDHASSSWMIGIDGTGTFDNNSVLGL